jgi:nitroimidazol reductase NimA-like FMN-containing flavoprotein (pyridoxamine 5'-phosphate oxidase superfamily)
MAIPTTSAAAPLRGKKRWAFLERQKTIRVATVIGDNAIHVSPLWYVVKDEVIYLPFDAARKHRHRDAIDNGGKLSAVVDAGDEFATVHGVMLEGTARRVEDPELHAALDELVLEKYFYTGHPYLEDYINMGKYYGRIWYAIEPTREVGWDLRVGAVLGGLEARTLPDHVLAKHGRRTNGNGSNGGDH